MVAWWGEVLVWHGVAYHDGNGCGGAAQVQHFPIPALELPAAIGVRGAGICNVMVEEELCIKFFPSFTYVIIYYWPVGMVIEVCNGKKSRRLRQLFFIFGRPRRPVNLSMPPPPKPKKLWRILVRHYKIH